MDLTMLAVVFPIVLALVVIQFEIMKDSEYRREMVRRKERKQILSLMRQIKGVSANPDINDFHKKVESAIKSRNEK